jgi:hypothetical protein
MSIMEVQVAVRRDATVAGVFQDELRADVNAGREQRHRARNN